MPLQLFYDSFGNMSLAAPLSMTGNSVVHSLGFDEVSGNKRLDVMIVLLTAAALALCGFLLMYVLVHRKLHHEYGGTRMIGKAYITEDEEEYRKATGPHLIPAPRSRSQIKVVDEHPV